MWTVACMHVAQRSKPTCNPSICQGTSTSAHLHQIYHAKWLVGFTTEWKESDAILWQTWFDKYLLKSDLQLNTWDLRLSRVRSSEYIWGVFNMRYGIKS